MDWTSLIFLAFALCFDSVAVSAVVGMCSNQSSRVISRIVRFCLILAIMQGFMPLLGWLIACNLRHVIEKWDHWIAFALLFSLGSKMIADYFKKEEENENPLFIEYTSISHSLLFGFATSIDALIVGVTMAFLDLRFISESQLYNMLTASAVILVVTLICSLAGASIGRFGSKNISQKSNILGGIILILIGFKILLEHLNIF